MASGGLDALVAAVRALPAPEVPGAPTLPRAADRIAAAVLSRAGHAYAGLLRGAPGAPGTDGEPPPPPPPAKPMADVPPQQAAEARALRRRLHVILDALAVRVENEFPEVLRLAQRAWDQVDTLSVIDRDLAHEILSMRRAAQAMADDAEVAAPARAVAVEARLALDGAVGLVSLLERRLSTLIRLRLRATDADGADPDLMPNGRPFLDVAAALRQAARCWA
jgi:hypothetical protein